MISTEGDGPPEDILMMFTEGDGPPVEEETLVEGLQVEADITTTTTEDTLSFLGWEETMDTTMDDRSPISTPHRLLEIWIHTPGSTWVSELFPTQLIDGT